MRRVKSFWIGCARSVGIIIAWRVNRLDMSLDVKMLALLRGRSRCWSKKVARLNASLFNEADQGRRSLVTQRFASYRQGF